MGWFAPVRTGTIVLLFVEVAQGQGDAESSHCTGLDAEIDVDHHSIARDIAGDFDAAIGWLCRPRRQSSRSWLALPSKHASHSTASLLAKHPRLGVPIGWVSGRFQGYRSYRAKSTFSCEVDLLRAWLLRGCMPG